MMATPQAAANLTTQTAQAAVQPEPIQKVRVFFLIIYHSIFFIHGSFVIFPRTELSLFLYQVFIICIHLYLRNFSFFNIEQKNLHLTFQFWQN